MAQCSCTDQAGVGQDKCELLNASYVFAGLAMMLNIRLSYSSAPYALIRFRLPENLFSVFVRRMASALELWCLPSMLLGNIVEYSLKGYYLNWYKKPENAEWASHYSNLILSSSANDTSSTYIADSELKPAREDKFKWIIIPSIATQWLNFLTYVILLVVYLMGGDQGHLTLFYLVIAISGFVFGINMVLLYAVDWNYIPVYMVGENSFPIVTSFMHYLTTLIFGNRRKWNSDYLVVMIDIGVAIVISFGAAVVWTVAYGYYDNGKTGGTDYGHIFAEGFDTTSKVRFPEIISPTLMVIVGMGLVYAIYPGIAPGMIVPFYLVDKIEMVLLIATFFPPIIVATLQLVDATKPYSPKTKYSPADSGMGGWKKYTGGDATFYHAFDLLIVLKITLAGIFIYSLHYRDSDISRSIINQPKMSTALSIIFYMCHECLLALGFPGVIGNNGGTYVMLPAQYVGALFMIFLAFYSEGYIIEYKSHDPANWPTTGITTWNAFCFWVRVTCKIIYPISRGVQQESNFEISFLI